MAKEKNPYIVQTTGGTFCSDHPTMGEADASAKARNDSAEKMELSVRYEAIEREES